MSPTSTATIISPINKEDINTLRFPTEEVLMSSDAIEQRKILLERAVVLGNTFKGKTKLIFEDDECIRQIETHIWGLTDKRVILKQGIVIPIHRIHEVKL
ncbi:MAG: hypothetical protein HY063_02005 [Bacteroidetes bacterium]|nr:hypothetical protein [Bacteroidota bacterium]